MFENAAQVSTFARELYGEDLGPVRGVSHVVAIDRLRRVIRIGPSSPKSETDLRVLHLARARAGAILVSGAVLRSEPELRYEMPPALLAWRRSIGLHDPPWLAVLTRGDVPLDHPALAGWARPVVVTGDDAAARIAAHGGVAVIALGDPSARAAIDHMTDQDIGVSIEAGPRTALPLYDPLAIDELMLSVYQGEIDASLDAGAFLSDAELGARGLIERSRREIDGWRFSLFRRGTAGGSGSRAPGSA
jgi:riboflavin biosynthesis pyrimidine reductase